MKPSDNSTHSTVVHSMVWQLHHSSAADPTAVNVQAHRALTKSATGSVTTHCCTHTHLPLPTGSIAPPKEIACMSNTPQ